MRQLRFSERLTGICTLSTCLLTLSGCLGEREASMGAESVAASQMHALEGHESASDDAGLTIKTRPDGLQEVDMRGRFQHQVVLRRAQDGGMQHACDRQVAADTGAGARGRRM